MYITKGNRRARVPVTSHNVARPSSLLTRWMPTIVLVLAVASAGIGIHLIIGLWKNLKYITSNEDEQICLSVWATTVIFLPPIITLAMWPCIWYARRTGSCLLLNAVLASFWVAQFSIFLSWQASPRYDRSRPSMLYLSINNNFRSIVLFCSTLTMGIACYNTIAAAIDYGYAVFRRRATEKTEKGNKLACDAMSDEESTLKRTESNLNKNSVKFKTSTKSEESAGWI